MNNMSYRKRETKVLLYSQNTFPVAIVGSRLVVVTLIVRIRIIIQLAAANFEILRDRGA